MTHNLLLTSQISIMAKIEFKMKLPTTPKKLYDLCTDFENHKKAFPSQLKNIEIIEEDEFKITTKEILVFNTYFKNTEIHRIFAIIYRSHEGIIPAHGNAEEPGR